ncbi:hypothetical protein AB8615_01390 [Litorimonas sp. RW-G-Af-16]|uniref:hypothetical protein n=1 Tax=Litorimonas sp. RW-G-Af-16 TaxID=3241168 RepID=UPI003AAE05BD
MSKSMMIDAASTAEQNNTKVPVNYADRALGILACFAVTWGLLGLLSFTFFVTADLQALSGTYRPEQIAYILDTPFWVRVGQALGVFGMLTGSVYLLLRRKSAYYWFMWSLLGTLTVLLDTILRSGFQTMGGMESGVNIAVTVVGIFMFWGTYSAYQEGQLTGE